MPKIAIGRIILNRPWGKKDSKIPYGFFILNRP